MLLGVLLYRLGWLSDRMVRELSLLVFRVGLPLVLFSGAIKVNYLLLGQAVYLLAGIVTTVLVLGAALLYARLRGWHGENGAIFVQGAYRGNMGVMGVALCAAAYGEAGLALAALPVAILTILYNIIAVVLLNRVYGSNRSRLTWLRGIALNPLIIGISAGVLVSLLQLPVPADVQRGLSMFASGFLPLALIGIGASLNLRALRGAGWLTLEAAAWKLVLAPALGVAVAVGLGIHGAELGVLFLLMAAPVAAASYIMVMAAGGNASLAANIVVLSTLLSAFTLTLGLALLQWFGLF